MTRNQQVMVLSLILKDGDCYKQTQLHQVRHLLNVFDTIGYTADTPVQSQDTATES